MTEVALGACILIIIIQQYHAHRLINKLLSRNYYEYQQAESLTKQEPSAAPLKRADDTAPEEDLNHVF